MDDADPVTAGPPRAGLSGLKRRSLFVFVGRWREFAAVKRARDFLHFLEHLDFPGEGQRRRF